MYKYIILRSKRKTIAIHISPYGDIKVRAPLKTPQNTIDSFIVSKQKWIEQKLEIAVVKNNLRIRFSIVPGDKLTLLGKNYPLIIGNECLFNGNQFIISDDTNKEIKPQIISIYKQLAKDIILPRIAFYSEKMALYPSAVHITDASARWGSCSGRNSLNFSWKLILGTLSAVDYVVVHELAHIKHHDHSRDFWSIVSGMLPDYIDRKKTLQDLQEKIFIESW